MWKNQLGSFPSSFFGHRILNVHVPALTRTHTHTNTTTAAGAIHHAAPYFVCVERESDGVRQCTLRTCTGTRWCMRLDVSMCARTYISACAVLCIHSEYKRTAVHWHGSFISYWVVVVFVVCKLVLYISIRLLRIQNFFILICFALFFQLATAGHQWNYGQFLIIQWVLSPRISIGFHSKKYPAKSAN